METGDLRHLVGHGVERACQLCNGRGKSSPSGTSWRGSQCADAGVSSQDVEVAIVVQHRHIHSKCHRPDQAVGQCADRLARLSARAVQARCGFVACQSFDWQVRAACQEPAELLVMIGITSARQNLHDHDVSGVHRHVVLE